MHGNPCVFAILPPGEKRRVSCRWTVPPGTAGHHLDLRLEVWNPHLLFGGPKSHRFFDTGWVAGFEVLEREAAGRLPVFISYSYDDEDHVRRVRQLSEELRRHGVPTILDQTDLRPGQDISHFIESSVTRAGVRLLYLLRGIRQESQCAAARRRWIRDRGFLQGVLPHAARRANSVCPDRTEQPTARRYPIAHLFGKCPLHRHGRYPVAGRTNAASSGADSAASQSRSIAGLACSALVKWLTLCRRSDLIAPDALAGNLRRLVRSPFRGERGWTLRRGRNVCEYARS